MFLSFITSLTILFSGGRSSVGPDYIILKDDKFNNGFPESHYDKIIKRVKNVYEPIIVDEGGELKILSDWTDGAVNMWAERYGNTYILEIPGGMVRYYLINEVAFVISICHELGHLLGGDPKSGQISYEGQSDYFANLECSRIILEDMALYKPIEIDTEVIDYCSDKEDDYCEFLLQGSKSLSSLYAEIAGASFPQISNFDNTEVSKTLVSHPSAQCRLDTFVASYEQGKRPSCWFKD